MRFQNRVRALREKQLLQAAGAYLLWKGCLRFRVEDVATACGVARGTCYRHFPTRPAFLEGAVDHLDASLSARLASPPANLKSARAVMRWVILQGVDAQAYTWGLRDRRSLPDPDALQGRAWPCCLRQYPCPYRGAARSLEVIGRLAGDRLPVRDNPISPHLLARLLLVTPLLVEAASGSRGLPRPGDLRPLVEHLIERVMP